MQRLFAHRFTWSLAALVCISTMTVGCASSSPQKEAESDEAAGSTSQALDSNRSSESATNKDAPKGEARSKSPRSPMSPGGQGASSEDREKATISDAQLKQFGAVTQKMKQIQVETRRKLKSAQSRQKAATIKKEAQRRIQQVFDSVDMTQKEYETIAKRLKSEPELQQRLRKQMQSSRSK